MDLSSVLVYLLKVLAIQGVFYLFYWLVLQRRISHGLNRGYLLASMLTSFLIPFIVLPMPALGERIVDSQMLIWIAEPISNSDVTKLEATKAIKTWPLLPWVYFILVTFLFARSFLHLIGLQKLKKQSEYVKKRWFKLLK